MLNGTCTNGVSVKKEPNGQFTEASARVRRLLEKSWPIDDHLKNENADGLFRWIGKCISEVVRAGCETLDIARDTEVALGVTFSFPMVQRALSEATLMSMGKGFAISSNLDLGSLLTEGYAQAKSDDLPPLRVAAISNDSVSTLISFIYKFDETENRRASMGVILGTGSNATVPLKLSQLHPSKHPQNISILPGERAEDVRIAVNTEWSINGSASPLREHGLVSRWDRILDSQNETPGFQPLEYMTAGRYLGELGRIMLVAYMTEHLGIPESTLPERLRQKHSLTTTFLSHFKPLEPAELLLSLIQEFPESTGTPPFRWTEDLAAALYHIGKAIEVRAAGIIAAATMALLTLAGELPPGDGDRDTSASSRPESRELGVGYTGGCIVHFQDYLLDCQDYLDQLMERKYGSANTTRVVLSPCHDGGITGAGILVAAASSSKETEMQ